MMVREKRNWFLRRFKPNTLAKKCSLIICVVAVGLLMLAGKMMNSWAFHFLEPELLNNFSVLTSGVSAKISYILHQDTQYLIKYYENERLQNYLNQYVSVGELEELQVQKERLEENIRELLETENFSSTQAGAIVSERDAVIILDWKECISNEWMEPYGQVVMESEWFAELPQVTEQMAIEYPTSKKRGFSKVFPADSEKETEEFIAYFMKKQLGKHDCLFVMIEPFSDFRNLYQDFVNVGISDFCLLGREEEILFQNDSESIFDDMSEEERNALFTDQQYEQKMTEYAHGTALGFRISFQIEELKMVLYLPYESLLRPYHSYIQMVYYLFVVFTAILVVIICLIMNRGMWPLKKLAAQMDEVQEGVYTLKPAVQSEDEIGRLADTFYRMMERIQKQEEKEKRIEYSLMVSQIDPHFIYNTLYTITYLAEMEQTEEIIVINKALTKMLRDRLKITKHQTYDLLENEKAQLEAYLTIQQYLCSNQIEMEFHVDESSRDAQYPKHVLQPLVENAIVHGILLHRDENECLIPGKIQIFVKTENGFFVTIICDNGIGMTEEQICRYFEELPRNQIEEDPLAGTHIGIYNIRVRLNYLYGEKLQIRAKNRTEGGLEIILRFPQ